MPVILAIQETEINQEDHGSKPVQANSLREPILKKPITKKGLVEWLNEYALSSNLSATKKKKIKKNSQHKK
jgi:hypothetical protein